MAVTDTRLVMGGHAVITIVGGTQELLDSAFELALACEHRWSRFSRDSEIAQLNAAGGEELTVSPLTVALVDAMIDGFALTSGDFNPTLLREIVSIGYSASLVSDQDTSAVPTDAHPFDSLDDILLTDTSVQLPTGMSLDPGGIGKGFAADLVAAAVMVAGARGVMVSMSGDVVVEGESPQPGGWLLGVENPFDESENVEVVRLIEGAIVTSSQRKKKFGTGHHLIDPRTKLSAVTPVQTVSVIAATGAKAEVLAKSGFLRPTTEYLEWLPTVGAAGMVIDDSGSRSESSNWAGYH